MAEAAALIVLHLLCVSLALESWPGSLPHQSSPTSLITLLQGSCCLLTSKSPAPEPPPLSPHTSHTSYCHCLPWPTETALTHLPEPSWLCPEPHRCDFTGSLYWQSLFAQVPCCTSPAVGLCLAGWKAQGQRKQEFLPGHYIYSFTSCEVQ